MVSDLEKYQYSSNKDLTFLLPLLILGWQVFSLNLESLVLFSLGFLFNWGQIHIDLRKIESNKKYRYSFLKFLIYQYELKKKIKIDAFRVFANLLIPWILMTTLSLVVKSTLSLHFILFGTISFELYFYLKKYNLKGLNKNSSFMD